MLEQIRHYQRLRTVLFTVFALAWLAVAMVWVPGGSTALRALWLMALLLPATEVATVLVNRLFQYGRVRSPS